MVGELDYTALRQSDPSLSEESQSVLFCQRLEQAEQNKQPAGLVADGSILTDSELCVLKEVRVPYSFCTIYVSFVSLNTLVTQCLM